MATVGPYLTGNSGNADPADSVPAGRDDDGDYSACHVAAGDDDNSAYHVSAGNDIVGTSSARAAISTTRFSTLVIGP
jgi:hypothetical protein